VLGVDKIIDCYAHPPSLNLNPPCPPQLPTVQGADKKFSMAKFESLKFDTLQALVDAFTKSTNGYFSQQLRILPQFR
jgi:hypothetical protein